MLRVLALLLSLTGLSACGTLGGPFDDDIGGEVVLDPPLENFRGQPVIKVTFVAAIDPSAETTFLFDYAEFDLDESAGERKPSTVRPNFERARTNLNGMLAKNVFYAMHLAKYLKLRADGDFLVILDPVTLRYEIGSGYLYQSFEEKMPPADIAPAILNMADDYIAGREVAIRAGDYISIQNHIRKRARK